MTPNVIPATTTDPSGIIIPGASIGNELIFIQIAEKIGLMDFFTIDGILNVLNILWSVYAVFAYIISILLLLIYVYASTRFKQLLELRAGMVAERERIYEERYRTNPKNSRLEDMTKHIASENPNDWKLAIIEADILLDETLKEKGYAGVSLGERLRSISPTQLQSLDDAWQAHKVRNQIAHGGADFVLTHRLAEETIKQYRRVFAEFGIH
jgi:hypothetical protein